MLVLYTFITFAYFLKLQYICVSTCLTYCFRVTVSAVSSLVGPAHGLICCYLYWCDIFEQINLIWFDLIWTPGVTGQILAKFAHNVARSSLLNLLKSDVRYSTVWMPQRRMKASWPISPILTQKLVAMATSLQRSEKDDQIGNLPSNTYHMVKNLMKIGRVYSEIALLKVIKNKKMKEINANKTYSPRSRHAKRNK